MKPRVVRIPSRVPVPLSAHAVVVVCVVIAVVLVVLLLFVVVMVVVVVSVVALRAVLLDVELGICRSRERYCGDRSWLFSSLWLFCTCRRSIRLFSIVR